MTRKIIACSALAIALSMGTAHAATTYINAGGSSLAYPTYVAEFELFQKTNSSIQFTYSAVGSGSGQLGFLTNTFMPTGKTQWWPVPSGTLSYGYDPTSTPPGAVDVGASDAVLNGTTQITNPATGGYAESAVDGPAIQIPTLGVPVTVAFNASGVTKLQLTPAQVCGVFSGQITDWNTLDSAIPAGTQINVTYRSDGSGTTFLTTQYLNAQCNSGNSSFPEYPVPIVQNFVASTGGVFTSSNVPGNFTGESGSGAVASHLVATAYSIGYLSPDYTSIAPKSANTTSLVTAYLQNSTDGKYYQPTVANTIAGLAAAGAGATNATPPANKTAAMDPLNWVPLVPNTTKGYPIVGYTTMDLSSCYANMTIGKTLASFLKDQYTNSSYKTLIENNGLVPLANTKEVKYTTAVINTFLSNNSGYNLNIDNAKLCAGLAGR